MAASFSCRTSASCEVSSLRIASSRAADLRRSSAETASISARFSATSRISATPRRQEMTSTMSSKTTQPACSRKRHHSGLTTPYTDSGKSIPRMK